MCQDRRWPQRGQRRKWWSKATTMRRRNLGRVGVGGDPGGAAARRVRHRFPPDPHGLQERHRHLAQQGVGVQAAPASSLVVIETQPFLELLMRLLAAPARLDGGGELLEAGISGMADEMELALGGAGVPAHQPAFFGW